MVLCPKQSSRWGKRLLSPSGQNPDENAVLTAKARGFHNIGDAGCDLLRAAGAGLVDGYNATTYAPGDAVTREQLAVTLWRYAKYKGWDVSMGEDTNILSYADAFDVSEWAIPTLQWACGAGIMTGTTDNRLAPKAQVTRAELARMLQLLME